MRAGYNCSPGLSVVTPHNCIPVMQIPNARRSIHVLALMEAASVTGPAKNLIGFGRWLGSPEGRATGVRLSVATFDRNARAHEADSFVGAARAAGIDVHVLQERRRFDLSVLTQLSELVTSVNPNVIQTHNGKSHLLVKLLPSVRSERAWLAFQHGYTATDVKLRIYNQLDRISLRSADRVISVCQAFAPKLVAFGVRPERIRAMHNSVVAPPSTDESVRSALLGKLGIQAGTKVILSVGRLSYEKGHADLIRALTMLSGDHGAWRLVLL